MKFYIIRKILKEKKKQFLLDFSRGLFMKVKGFVCLFFSVVLEVFPILFHFVLLALSDYWLLFVICCVCVYFFAGWLPGANSNYLLMVV